MKLMIVDDSVTIRTRIGSIIKANRIKDIFIVGVAKNGEEAIAIFNKTHPDIITMDLTMPEMDGIEAIRQIRKLSSEVKILVVSALGDKTTAIKALKMGAYGFLNKPFTDAQLEESLLKAKQIK